MLRHNCKALREPVICLDRELVCLAAFVNRRRLPKLVSR